MITLILLIAFIGVNIALAYYDAYKIKNNIRIKHGVNALLYCILIALFWKLLTVVNVIGLLLIRIPVFNTFLNIFRGLPPTHLSSTTTSIIDRVMNKFIEKIGYWTYNTIVFILAVLLCR